MIVNPYYYVELEVMYGVNRIVTLKNHCFGKVLTVYGGVIFCRDDRQDIKELDDLVGKSFMAPYERAFGGWVSVLRVFHEYGINPYRDFTEFRFGGTQDAVVYAVRDGKVDAGSVKTDTLERMNMEGKISIEEFKIINEQIVNEEFPFIHSTRLYPEWSFAKHKHTSIELAEKVAIALLKITLDTPAAVAGRYAGWTVPLNYQSVHECLKELRLGPYKDFGKVTFEDILRKYWHWFVIAFSILILMFTAVVYVSQLNRKLRTYQDQLRSLTSELSLTEEKERRHIATELHDHTGQTLAFSKIKLETLQELTKSEDLTRYLKEIETLIDKAMEETKSLAFDLSPPILYDLGFEAALEWLSRQINQQYSIQIDFEDDGQPKLLSNDLSIVLFQAVRELLINVVKHAQAEKAKVSIAKVGKEIKIIVEDDGRGIDTDITYPYLKKNHGFGLFNIYERMGYIGGGVNIESEAGHGTKITIVLPLKDINELKEVE